MVYETKLRRFLKREVLRSKIKTRMPTYDDGKTLSLGFLMRRNEAHGIEETLSRSLRRTAA